MSGDPSAATERQTVAAPGTVQAATKYMPRAWLWTIFGGSATPAWPHAQTSFVTQRERGSVQSSDAQAQVIDEPVATTQVPDAAAAVAFGGEVRTAPGY